MIEGLIVFAIGYVCGHYTDQVKAYFIKLFDKFKKKETEETVEEYMSNK